MFSAALLTASLTSTTSTTSTTGGATDGTLSSNQWTLLLVVLIAGALLAGLVVILARAVNRKRPDSDQSVVRSWIAIVLVFALICLCAAAFAIDDTQLRSTLIGGLVASAGTAVAFYFSSKGADQARADVLRTATTLAQGGSAPSSFSAQTPGDARSGEDYTYTFVADGTPPLAYTKGSGSLPAGLDLATDGRLTGRPTDAAATTYTFSVVATNALGSFSSGDIRMRVGP